MAPTSSGEIGGSYYSTWHLPLWWSWWKSLQLMAPPPLVEMVEVITVDGPYLLWWKWWKSLQQIAPTPSGRNGGNHYSRGLPHPLVEMVDMVEMV